MQIKGICGRMEIVQKNIDNLENLLSFITTEIQQLLLFENSKSIFPGEPPVYVLCICLHF